MGQMRIMNRSGDTAVLWEKDDALSVAEVRAQFDQLIAEGNLAFKIDPSDPTQGELVRTFDPDADELLVSPALRGG